MVHSLYSTCPFLSGFFHLEYFQCLSMLLHVSVLYSFVCWITFQWMGIPHFVSLFFWGGGILDVSTFRLLWLACSKHLWMSSYLDICFQFFGFIPRSGIVWSYSNSIKIIKAIEELSEIFLWLVFILCIFVVFIFVYLITYPVTWYIILSEFFGWKCVHIHHKEMQMVRSGLGRMTVTLI